jgi:hypothetical protein
LHEQRPEKLRSQRLAAADTEHRTCPGSTACATQNPARAQR